MPLIDLETDTLHASAADTLEVSQTISTAVTTLQSALAGTASMAGDDDGAGEWIKGYHAAVTGPHGIATSSTTLIRALNSHSLRLAITASNHAHADAESGGEPETRPPLAPPEAPPLSPPEALGKADPSQPAWLIEARRFAEEIFWPNGAPDRLRGAGQAFEAFAQSLSHATADLAAARAKILTQNIPSIPKILAENDTLHQAITAIADAARQTGQNCHDYAEHIEHTRTEILRELRDLLRDSAIIEGASAVLSFITAGVAEIAGQVVEAGRLVKTARVIEGIIRAYKTVVNGLKVVLETIGEKLALILKPLIPIAKKIAKPVVLAGKVATYPSHLSTKAGEALGKKMITPRIHRMVAEDLRAAPYKEEDKIGYRPFLSDTPKDYRKIYKHVYKGDEVPPWPEDNGYLEGTKILRDHFPEGVRLDRIGQETGGFLGTEGDSIASRSMHPDTVLYNPRGLEYHVYEGTGKQLDPDWRLYSGEAAPAFGQPGGAYQWSVVLKENERETVPIKQLVEEGYLKEVPQ